MKRYFYTVVMLASLLTPLTSQAANTVETLLEEYRNQGAEQLNTDAGKQFWNHSFKSGKTTRSRSCASCHTAHPGQAGKHVRTGKLIEPLAPSANPERLKDIKKVRKWFKRNCLWTVGRECTPQEKGNVLLFLNSL
jgi:hypothetical protein